MPNIRELTKILPQKGIIDWYRINGTRKDLLLLALHKLKEEIKKENKPHIPGEKEGAIDWIKRMHKLQHDPYHPGGISDEWLFIKIYTRWTFTHGIKYKNIRYLLRFIVDTLNGEALSNKTKPPEDNYLIWDPPDPLGHTISNSMSYERSLVTAWDLGMTDDNWKLATELARNKVQIADNVARNLIGWLKLEEERKEKWRLYSRSILRFMNMTDCLREKGE